MTHIQVHAGVGLSYIIEHLTFKSTGKVITVALTLLLTIFDGVVQLKTTNVLRNHSGQGFKHFMK
jgi:succinate dehydrogenase hydrophobic anchor subunit